MDGQFPSFSPLMAAERAVCPQSRDDGLDESLSERLLPTDPRRHVNLWSVTFSQSRPFVAAVWDCRRRGHAWNLTVLIAPCSPPPPRAPRRQRRANPLLLLRPPSRNNRVGFPLPASRPGRPADVLHRLTPTTRSVPILWPILSGSLLTNYTVLLIEESNLLRAGEVANRNCNQET